MSFFVDHWLFTLIVSGVVIFVAAQFYDSPEEKSRKKKAKRNWERGLGKHLNIKPSIDESDPEEETVYSQAEPKLLTYDAPQYHNGERLITWDELQALHRDELLQMEQQDREAEQAALEENYWNQMREQREQEAYFRGVRDAQEAAYQQAPRRSRGMSALGFVAGLTYVVLRGRR